jgi:hypothetical protein
MCEWEEFDARIYGAPSLLCFMIYDVAKCLSSGFRVDARIYSRPGLLHLDFLCYGLRVGGVKSVQSLWRTGYEKDKVDGRVFCRPALLHLGFMVI